MVRVRGFVHKTETQHQFIHAVDNVVLRNRFRLPGFERAFAGGRDSEGAATAARRGLGLTAHQSLFLKAVERGINCAGAVAESTHRGAGEDFPEIVTRALLLVEQPEQRVAKQ